MLWPDVVDLKQFYASPTGQMAAGCIRRRVQGVWPSVAGESLLGIGFATPFLLPYLGEAERVLACMPAAQGVIHWPVTQENLTFLADEAELPLADNSVSRIILAHALEHSELVRALLQEVWRVLTPTGKVIVLVPNRTGIWARSPGSPFSLGTPFTAWQLKSLLFEQRLTPLATQRALFFPPLKTRFVLRASRVMDEVGARICPGLSGVILMEAEKQLYAPGLVGRVRGRQRIYRPTGAPAMTLQR